MYLDKTKPSIIVYKTAKETLILANIGRPLGCDGKRGVYNFPCEDNEEQTELQRFFPKCSI